MRLRTSFSDFTWGMVKRAWALIPALLLDPFDLYGRLFDVEWDVPLWLMWALFGFGLFVAAWLTYREVWIRVQPNRRLDLLMDRDRGKNLEIFFSKVLTTRVAIIHQEIPNEAETVEGMRAEMVAPWLDDVYSHLTDQERAAFDRGSTKSPGEVGSFLTIEQLGYFVNRRMERLRSICEAALLGGD